MADDIERVILEIRADINDLKAKMGEAHNAAKKTGDEMHRSFKAAAVGIGAAGAGIAAFAFAITSISRRMDAFTSVLKKQADAEALLKNNLGRVSKALLDFASAQQKVSTYEDDAIIRAEASLAAYVKDEEQIKRLIPAVMDLAAAKGMDLVSAADLVTKSIASETNALGRYGISLKGANGLNEKSEVLIRKVEQAYGGAAKALAETPIGVLEQQKVLLGDIKEEYAKFIVPAQKVWNGALIEMGKSGVDALQKVRNLISGKGFRSDTELSNLDNVLASISKRQKELSGEATTAAGGKPVEDPEVRAARLNAAATVSAAKIRAEIERLDVYSSDYYERKIALSKELSGIEIDTLKRAGELEEDKKKLYDIQAQVKVKHIELDSQIAAITAEAAGNTREMLMATTSAEVAQLTADTSLALAALDKQYEQSAITLQEYYDIKRQLAEGIASQEIAAIQAQIAAEKEGQKRIELDAKLYERKLALQQQILELDKEQIEAEKKLAEKRAQNAQANEKTMEEVRKRLDSSEIQTYEQKLQHELDLLRAKQEEEIRMLREHSATAQQIDSAQSMHRQEMSTATAQAETSYYNNMLGTAQQIVGQVQQVYDEYYSLVAEQEQQKIDAEMSNMQLQGATAEQMAARKAEMLKSSNARAKEAWEKQKRADLASAIIGTAMSVINALQTKPFYVGLAMATLAGVLGGIQIAKINQQTYPGLAEGGMISTGSTSTADDVPARLSRGEFVSPASSVGYYGPGVYEAMRTRSLPRDMFAGVGAMRVRTAPSGSGFASGGMVAGQGAATNGSTTIVNFLDPALMNRYINSIEGQRAIVNVINERAYEVRRAISE